MKSHMTETSRKTVILEITTYIIHVFGRKKPSFQMILFTITIRI